MLKKNFKITIILILSFNLSGCKSSDESILGLGMMIIFAFLIFWGISTFFPRFQNLKLVKKLIKKVSKTIEKLSILMMIGFGFLALISIFLFDGVEVLYSGVFTLAFIGSFYLRKLPYATEEDRHPVELKMIIGVVTFIIALLWLILFGADMLRL